MWSLVANVKVHKFMAPIQSLSKYVEICLKLPKAQVLNKQKLTNSQKMFAKLSTPYLTLEKLQQVCSTQYKYKNVFQPHLNSLNMAQILQQTLNYEISFPMLWERQFSRLCIWDQTIKNLKRNSISAALAALYIPFVSQ